MVLVNSGIMKYAPGQLQLTLYIYIYKLWNCKTPEEILRINVTSLPNETDNNLNRENKDNVNIPASTSRQHNLQKVNSMINEDDM